MASRLFARGEYAELREAYWHTAFFTAVFTFPIFALTGPFPERITMTMFEARYTGCVPILALFAVGYYVNAALGFNAYTLQVCGRQRVVVAINVAVAVVNLTLSPVLVPYWGAWDAAFSQRWLPLEASLPQPNRIPTLRAAPRSG